MWTLETLPLQKKIKKIVFKKQNREAEVQGSKRYLFPHPSLDR